MRTLADTPTWTPLMSGLQQRGGWQWRLAPGQALRVEAQPRQRYLAVREGRVWLTGTPGATGDVWLDAGEHFPIEQGVEVVLEAWPSARFELMEAPASPACAPRWRCWFSRVFGALAPASVQPACA